MGWPEGLPGVDYGQHSQHGPAQPRAERPLDLSRLSERLRLALGLPLSRPFHRRVKTLEPSERDQ